LVKEGVSFPEKMNYFKEEEEYIDFINKCEDL
jgi:hypothetical protein